MNPLCNNCRDIFQRMTQHSSLLLLHYLLKSLTLFSTAAASQSERNWALSGVIHLFFISFLPPAGSVAVVFVIAPPCGVLNLSEWAPPRSFGQCVEALHSQPRSRIFPLSHQCWWGGGMRRRPAHASLPPSLSVQILKEIAENENKVSQGDVEGKRGRDKRQSTEP